MFSHSGSIGDCIFHLPFLRGQRLCLYPLRNAPWKLRKPLVVSLLPLLHSQGCRAFWSVRAVGQDLDGWREFVGTPGMNLQDMMAASLNLPSPDPEIPWLKAHPRKVARVIFSRSFRYRNPLFDWKHVHKLYASEAVFVGLEDEHRDFCSVVGYVPFYKTINFLELAEVISGSEICVMNQSSPGAIAEGLKKIKFLEVTTEARLDNCRFNRSGLLYDPN